MNYLDNVSRRPLSKAPEHKKDQRVFGRDITNVAQNKAKVNQSFQSKPSMNCQKMETRLRSKSIVNPITPVKETQAISQYEVDIINEISQDNNCVKQIKCPTISLKMRAILVDWLVDVHNQFQLKQQTLFHAIRLLDDYCSIAQQIIKQQLQLIGITCLWISSKYEEIYPPRMKKYITVTDNTYTQTQIHETQSKILVALNFNIIKTTTLQYLSIILKQQLDSKSMSFCSYLLQLCNFQFTTSQYKPTVIVLTAVQMCERLLKQKMDMKKFKQIFKVQQDQINKCFKHLCRIVNVSSWQQLNAIKRKYSKVKHHTVGRIRLQKA